MMMRKFALGFVLLASFACGGAAKAGDLKVGQAFGAWVFQCNAVAQDKTVCSFATTVLSADTKQAVVDLRISRPKADGPFVVFALLPLGLNIQAGVKAAVDGADPADLPLRACFKKGCIATAELKDETVAVLKAGTDLALTFEMAGKSITATMKLQGLSDALAAAGW